MATSLLQNRESSPRRQSIIHVPTSSCFIVIANCSRTEEHNKSLSVSDARLRAGGSRAFVRQLRCLFLWTKRQASYVLCNPPSLPPQRIRRIRPLRGIRTPPWIWPLRRTWIPLTASLRVITIFLNKYLWHELFYINSSTIKQPSCSANPNTKHPSMISHFSDFSVIIYYFWFIIMLPQ